MKNNSLTVIKNKGFLRKVKVVLPILEQFQTISGKDGKQCIKQMQELGYNYLGEGINALCFSFGEDKVLRIELEYNKNGMYKWLSHTSGNKYRLAPKIFFLAKNKVSSRQTMLISVVERLKPISKSSFIKRGMKNVFFESFQSVYDYKMKDFEYYWEMMERCVKKEVVLKSIISLKEVKDIKEKLGKKINDIHSGNVMISLDEKRLVLTDPMN